MNSVVNINNNDSALNAGKKFICSIEKNEKIKETLKATKARRKTQECKVFELKIDKSCLNHESIGRINRLFLECKWLYNYVLSEKSSFTVSNKIKSVEILVNDVKEKRDLIVMGSQIKRDVIEELQQNIINLKKAKDKNIKIGKLKYKTIYRSINLESFGYRETFNIVKNRIRIQKIGQWITVNGVEQLNGYEISNAKFIQRAGDYYLNVTCFRDKQIKTTNKYAIGIDFGIKTQLTLSDGICGVNLQYNIDCPPSLKRERKKLSKKKKHSKNYYKQLDRVLRRYNHWTNQKTDVINKITNKLTDFKYVCYQDDNLTGWNKLWGKRMLHTGIGGITARLRKSATSIALERTYPSTKQCYHCGHKNEISLRERIFSCTSCGYIADRDFKSSMCIRKECIKKVGVEYAEVTPLETETSILRSMLSDFNNIPFLKASLVVDTGSQVNSFTSNSSHFWAINTKNND